MMTNALTDVPSCFTDSRVKSFHVEIQVHFASANNVKSFFDASIHGRIRHFDSCPVNWTLLLSRMIIISPLSVKVEGSNCHSLDHWSNLNRELVELNCTLAGNSLSSLHGHNGNQLLIYCNKCTLVPPNDIASLKWDIIVDWVKLLLSHSLSMDMLCVVWWKSARVCNEVNELLWLEIDT